MPRKKSQGRVYAEEICAKFPHHADMTLAKKIYKEKPLLFRNLEGTRTTVRQIRGHSGSKMKKDTKDKSLFKPVTGNTNPYKIPESHAEDIPPFKLPLACNNVLVISDLHIPYHNIEAITVALDYGKQKKVNTIFINGDLMDFHQVSRFQKNPHKRSIKQEFDATKAFLVSLRKAFPKAKIYWLKGNHDKRYEHWLLAKAPEVFDDEYYHLEERLRLNEEKIELIDDLVMCKIGKLYITHGHKILTGVFAPVNAARGVFTRTKSSAIVGHTHSVSEHTEKDLAGDLTTCWSTGCLCELNPEYARFVNKYAHGFAHVKTDKNGNFTVRNFRIKDGKLY